MPPPRGRHVSSNEGANEAQQIACYLAHESFEVYKSQKGQQVMAPSSFGPIAELRHAKGSPISLTVGGTFGGAAPLINYFTVHVGNLVSFDGELHFRGSPLWLLVAGSFLLSSKSVFCWGRNIFGEPWSALAMVAMLEGALILAPHWAIGVSALIFLVGLNAARYGSALALRDQLDQAREAADAAERAGSSPAPATTPSVVALANTAEEKKPRALPALTSPGCDAERDLYAGALDVAKRCASLSTETLRKELGIRQPTAAALIEQLERNGVIGRVNPSDRGRRPVLTGAESA